MNRRVVNRFTQLRGGCTVVFLSPLGRKVYHTTVNEGGSAEFRPVPGLTSAGN